MQENYELLNQVNEFYNSAWEKLIIIGSIAFAIVGIIIPLIIQWYQKKQLKVSEEKLENKFKNEIESLKESIKEDIKDILKEEIKDFEKKIDKIDNASNAKLLHLQGQKSMASKNYDAALWNFLKSARLYSKSDEYGNLQAMLEMIESLLDKITKENLDDIKITQNCDAQDIINKIQEYDEKNALDRIIVRINLKLAKLEK